MPDSETIAACAALVDTDADWTRDRAPAALHCFAAFLPFTTDRRHSMKIRAGIGLLAAQLVPGQAMRVDVSDFALPRFNRKLAA